MQHSVYTQTYTIGVGADLVQLYTQCPSSPQCSRISLQVGLSMQRSAPKPTLQWSVETLCNFRHNTRDHLSVHVSSFSLVLFQPQGGGPDS